MIRLIPLTPLLPCHFTIPLSISNNKMLPVEIPVLEKIRESAVHLIILLYVPQPLPHSAPPIAASLICPANNKEKTPRNIPVWEKIRQSLPLLI